MLSLLSLLLASGNVLRGDTERWAPASYPDPRTNHTRCNTWPNSTLCDPDHILTDSWRLRIHESINRQIERLMDSNVQYTEKASIACRENATDVKIYVILAKRIHTPENKSITEGDLTSFGNELVRHYGLDSQLCKNFVLLIGVEAAKLAYVRTGRDLRLPADFIQRVFYSYRLFNAKNYMEGLNKIVDEIGEQMIDPDRDRRVSSPAPTATTPIDPVVPLLNAVDPTTTTTPVAAQFVNSSALSTITTAIWEFGNSTAPTTHAGKVARGSSERSGAPWGILAVLASAIGVSIAGFALMLVGIRRERIRSQQVVGPKDRASPTPSLTDSYTSSQTRHPRDGGEVGLHGEEWLNSH